MLEHCKQATPAGSPTRTDNRGPRRRLHRLATAILVTAVLLTGAVSVGTAERADAMNPPQTNAYYVAALLGYANQPSSIASYWTQMFAAWKRPYAVPRVIFYGDYYGNRDTPCGNTALLRNNGRYCPADNTVVLDYEYMQDFIDAGGRYNLGDYAVGGFMAHEFGHGVEAYLGWPIGKSFRDEYAADCLAGMYTRWAYSTGRLTGGDYWEFHNWLLTTPVSTTHGNPVTRTQWYRYGYDTQSINSCALAYQATA